MDGAASDQVRGRSARPLPRGPGLHLAPGALLALALLAPACRPGGAPPPPERFLAAEPGLALVVPDLSRAARALDALLRAAAELPGASALVAQRAGLAAQLGFDPLDPAALAEAGLDASRGLAVGLAPGAGPVLILPTADGRRLEDRLLRLAAERLGATVRAAEVHQGRSVVVLREEAGRPAALAYLMATVERAAVVGLGPGGPDAVARAAARAPAGSLAASPAWQTARAALGPLPALLAFAPRGTALPLAGVTLGHDVALGAGADAGVGQLALALLPPPLAPAGQGGAPAPAAGPSSARLRRLDPRAVAALRWDGDPAELGRWVVGATSAPDRAWLAARGLDLQRDVFDALAPGAAASLSLARAPDLAGLDPVELRADPLRLLGFELVAEVRDEARARATLARLPALAAALAEPLRRAAPRAPACAGRTAPPAADRIRTPSGEIAWRLSGRRLAIAGGPPGALDRLLARLDGSGAGFSIQPPAAAAALSGGVGGAALDTHRLVEQVRALPEEAFGSGPGGFLVRALVARALQPAARLAALSVRADRSERALVITLTAEAAAAGEAVR